MFQLSKNEIIFTVTVGDHVFQITDDNKKAISDKLQLVLTALKSVIETCFSKSEDAKGKKCRIVLKSVILF
jgi:hypothetical protein